MLNKLICWFKGHEFKRGRDSNPFWRLHSFGSWIQCDRCNLNMRRKRWWKGKMRVGDSLTYSCPESFIAGIHKFEEGKDCVNCINSVIARHGYHGEEIINKLAVAWHNSYHAPLTNEGTKL